MPRKSKIPISVTIPTDFANFMREVARLIDVGDEAALNESDDLLQCDCAYGGLVDAESLRYGFRYFRGDAEDSTTWDIILDAKDVAQIAGGNMETRSLWQCSKESCDCLYPTKDSYCPHCDSARHFDDYDSRLRIQHPGESEDTLEAMRNLRQIILAILDYHDEHDGNLPPLFTTDSSGNRLHSWRSLILPYLDLGDIHSLIDFDKPWNADANSAAFDNIPQVYTGGNPSPLKTHVFAVSSPDTLWPEDVSRRLSDVQSGLSFTIAVVYSEKRSVHWMEPQDGSLDWVISENKNNPKLLAAFADGHVNVLSGIADDELRDLFRIS